MFDFPQPGEKYQSGTDDAVTVIGILADGIPWDLPYTCPSAVWNPYRKPYTIIVRIEPFGRVMELPLGHFLREFTCHCPDLFKRNPANRYTVLQIMANDPVLQIWRERNINIYTNEQISVIKILPPKPAWCDISRPQPDNSYRHYL